MFVTALAAGYNAPNLEQARTQKGFMIFENACPSRYTTKESKNFIGQGLIRRGAMRKFSSYGPVDTDLHYYVPRKELVDQALNQLLGENPDKGGHYITLWAPRQRGKTWIMQQVFASLQEDKASERFDVAVVALEHLKMEKDVNRIVQSIAREIMKQVGKKDIAVQALGDFYNIFTHDLLEKPLILILDEFDALAEAAISGIVGVFRNIYISRQYQAHKPTAEKEYLLHSVALVGVKAVLGVENVTGSPFNVQRSLQIPNLTLAEVAEMFQWYARESGQQVEQAVMARYPEHGDHSKGDGLDSCWILPGGHRIMVGCLLQMNW